MTTAPERGITAFPSPGPTLGDDEHLAVERVLRSGMLAQGPEVAAFESEFSAHVGARTCVAVNSGTSALLLSLLALGIGPGDEVIVPSFTFAATANAVVLAGARPVFADILPSSFVLDPWAVRAAITPRTAAMIPVHLYGHPAPMDELLDLARRHGLAVVEDCAQAHLAEVDGRPVGSLGDAAAFSFYPTKNMTTGEGGMVVCADAAAARRVRLLRNQGMERRYENEVAGHNMRMTDLQAAIGRVQLGRLPGFTRTRRANARFLTAVVEKLGGALVTPRPDPGVAPVWNQYTVRAADRDGLVAGLAALGIPVGVFYPVPVHRLPAYDLTLDLPATERAAAEVLSLPVHPGLAESDLARIATCLATQLGER